MCLIDVDFSLYWSRLYLHVFLLACHYECYLCFSLAWSTSSNQIGTKESAKSRGRVCEGNKSVLFARIMPLLIDLRQFVLRQYSRPENVTVIKRHSDNEDAFLSELMTCGVIIYDITRDPDQIEEARWILKGSVNTNLYCINFASEKRHDSRKYTISFFRQRRSSLNFTVTVNFANVKSNLQCLTCI